MTGTSLPLEPGSLQRVLEQVYEEQMPLNDAKERVYLDDGTDVTEVVNAAIFAKLIRGAGCEDGDRWILTEAGEHRLAEFWGPDRLPPGAGGYFRCWEHGIYDAGPGDVWACPHC